MTLTIDAVLTDIDMQLARAANDRKAPMHTPVVVTSDADARVMVLREWDGANRTLRFHTDVRSPKVGLIGDGAAVGVLFYDSEAKLQLRCRGIARIETDTPAADAAWSGSDTYARRCYLGDPPGEPSEAPTSGLPDWVEGERPTEEQLEPVRSNFAILLVTLDEVDWYHLSHDGHRRALIDLAGGEGQWLAP